VPPWQPASAFLYACAYCVLRRIKYYDDDDDDPEHAAKFGGLCRLRPPPPAPRGTATDWRGGGERATAAAAERFIHWFIAGQTDLTAQRNAAPRSGARRRGVTTNNGRVAVSWPVIFTSRYDTFANAGTSNPPTPTPPPPRSPHPTATPPASTDPRPLSCSALHVKYTYVKYAVASAIL